MVAGDISLQELETFCRLFEVTDRDEIEELSDHFIALDTEMRKLSKSQQSDKRDDSDSTKKSGGKQEAKKAAPGVEVMKREAPPGI